jgi:hypothetical protein
MICRFILSKIKNINDDLPEKVENSITRIFANFDLSLVKVLFYSASSIK